MPLSESVNQNELGCILSPNKALGIEYTAIVASDAVGKYLSYVKSVCR